MNKNSLPAVALLLDSSRGIYIPLAFVRDFDLSKWQGITQEAITECSNVENDDYWEAWASILDYATFTDNGYIWRLMQDGDLWAYCFELMTEEEKANFGMIE